MNNKKWAPMIVVLAIVVIVGGYFVFRNSSKIEDHVVKIGYLPTLGSAMYDVAKENQYFEKEGIKYEMTPIQTSNQILEALVRGDIDVSPVLSIIPILASEEVSSRKVEVFSISDYSLDRPFDKIIVKKGSSIQSIKDLAGKKIGVFPGSTAMNLLKKYFSDNNVDISKIEFIQITPPTQLAALYSGSIDALHSYEPNTTIALESDNAREIFGSVFATQLNHSPLGVGAISKDFVSKYPNLAKKVVGVFDKANGEIQNNPDGVRPIIAKAFKLDQNVASKVVLVHYSKSTNIDKNIFEQYLSVLLSAGEIKSKPDISNLFFELK